MNEEEIRKQSLQHVAGLEGRVNPGLPFMNATPSRSLRDVAERSLIVLALLQLVFEAPVEAIRSWLRANELAEKLMPSERLLLTKDELDQQALFDLSWSV